MNKLKQFIFGFCFFSLGLTGLQAQTIKFRFADGSQTEYLISEIRNITFSNDIMNVNKKDGNIVSLPVATIGKYNYSSLTTGINIPLEPMSDNDVVVFPNPASSDITISYKTNAPGKINIDLLNQNGQLVRHIEEEQSQSGNFTVNWDGKDSNGNILSTGTYICHVNSDGTKSTQKIVIIK
jgi:hypothetical protein